MSSGKLRAVLEAVIGRTEPKYDFWKGGLVSEDKVARCSAWVEDLKPTLNCS